MVKNPPANAGDRGSSLGSGRFPGERNGNPPQYSCLEHPMGREAWWATVYGVAKVSDRTEQQQQQIHGVTCVNGPPFPNIFADASTKALASTDWFLKELLKTFKKFGVEYHFNLGELSFPGEMRWNTNKKSESKDSLHD